MRGSTVPNAGKRVWAIAKRDHDIVTRDELVELGYSPKAIEHRLATKRLHRQAHGVYSVGSPNLTRYGRWMVAVKRCGPGAVLSFLSAAVLWGLWKWERGRISVTVPRARNPRGGGLSVSRRDLPSRHLTEQHGVPVTTVLRTLIDLATVVKREQLERMIGQADAKNLLRADTLREQLEHETCRGARILKDILDRDTFVLSHSELERLMVPIGLAAGIGRMEGQWPFGKTRVDFYFPETGIVVECQSLRYHRTEQQQRRDAERTQRHLLAGRTPVPVTHHQVKYENGYLERLLSSTAARTGAAAPSPASP